MQNSEEFIAITKKDFEEIIYAFRYASSIIWDMDNSDLTQAVSEYDEIVEAIFEKVENRYG